jgi:hypothetical protein
MRKLIPTSLGTEADQIAMKFKDEAGEDYEALFSTLETASLLSALPKLIEEIVAQPNDRNPMMPGMSFVQLLEKEEEVWLRISIGEHGLFHDYPVPKNTTLAEDLRFLADRVAARQETKVTHPQSDSPGRKH